MKTYGIRGKASNLDSEVESELERVLGIMENKAKQLNDELDDEAALEEVSIQPSENI